MKFTCEYSKKNDQFYVTPSGIAWSISKVGLIFGEQPETIMFAECDSYEDGFKLCDRMRKKMCYAAMTEKRSLCIICSDMREELSAKFYFLHLLESSTERGERVKVHIIGRRGTIMSLGWVNVSKDIIEKLFRFFVVVPEKPKQIIYRLRANLPARANGNHAHDGKHKARSKRGSGRKPSQCKERGCRQ